MKRILQLISTLTFIHVAVSLADYTVAIDGGPDAGSDPFEPAAPIYTLNGTATTQLDVNGVIADQELTFSMDNVNSGVVSTTGNIHLTKDDGDSSWDAWFDGTSNYVIKSYGALIQVTFNHKLNKDSMEECLLCGVVCDNASITSKGYMTLLDDYSFIGQMAGVVIGYNGKQLVKNSKYNDNFTQEFTDIQVSDQGVWSAEYDVTELAKNKLGGEGVIEVGPAADPVDQVDQTVSGSQKNGVFTWTTKSKNSSDSKVKVTIKHTDSALVTEKKPNSVSAAAQTRKF